MLFRMTSLLPLGHQLWAYLKGPCVGDKGVLAQTEGDRGEGASWRRQA